MPDFNPARYGPAVSRLLSPTRVCELGPCKPNRHARPLLEELTPAMLFDGRPIADQTMAESCIAALWLYHDFFDESHNISQNIDTPEGSYWHGILHRRQPDYANSKYWFRRVGRHPVFAPLSRAAAELAPEATLDLPAEFLATGGAWDPFAFVELCEAIARGRSQCGDLARAVQMREWELLFEHCHRRAINLPGF